MIINCKMSRYRSVAILDVCTKEVSETKSNIRNEFIVYII